MDRIIGLLEQEVKTTKQLTHLGFSRIHGVGFADGHRFWVREYVGGEDLGFFARRYADRRRDLFQRRGLPIALVLHIGARVCEVCVRGLWS